MDFSRVEFLISEAYLANTRIHAVLDKSAVRFERRLNVTHRIASVRFGNLFISCLTAATLTQ